MFSALPLKKRPYIPLGDDSTHSKRPCLETKSPKENMCLQTANKNYFEINLASLNNGIVLNKQQFYLVHESNVKDISVIWKDVANMYGDVYLPPENGFTSPEVLPGNIPNFLEPDTCNEPDNVAIASRQERNLPLAALDFNMSTKQNENVIDRDATNNLSLLAEVADSQSAIPNYNLPDFSKIGIDDDLHNNVKKRLCAFVQARIKHPQT